YRRDQIGSGAIKLKFPPSQPHAPNSLLNSDAVGIAIMSIAPVCRDPRRSPILGSSRHGERKHAMKTSKRKLMIAGMTACSIGLLFQMTVNTSPAQSGDAALIAKAKGIHDRVLKLDTHNDIEPSNFTAECNYTKRLTTQVNLPKMIEGGMDVTFI